MVSARCKQETPSVLDLYAKYLSKRTAEQQNTNSAETSYT